MRFFIFSCVDPEKKITAFVVSQIFPTFAAELKVDRFVLLATTGKNAKNPFLPFGFTFLITVNSLCFIEV